MNRALGYFRPGISVLTVSSAPPAEVAAHAERLLPYADEIVVVNHGDAAPGRLPERVRVVSAKEQGGRAESFRIAADLASHQWLLRLEVGESLGERSWQWLRRLLPHIAAACAIAGRDKEGNPVDAVPAALRVGSRYEARLWFAPWLLSAQREATLASMAQPGPGVEIENVAIGADVDPPPPVPAPPAPASSSAPAVLVLGMHRSGTSLLARVANLMGVELGERLHGPRDDNPLGFWEHMDAVAVNEALSEAASHAKSNWAWTLPVAATEDLVTGDTRAAMEGMAKALRANPRWGFKDPRTSLTLQAWAPQLGPSAAIVCVRDPRAVAASISARDHLPAVDGIRVWHAYNQVLLDLLAQLGVPTLVVQYEKFLAGIDAESRRIAAFLGAKLDPAALAAIREFADKGLEHHAFTQSLEAELPGIFAGSAIKGEIEGLLAMYRSLIAAGSASPSSQPAAAPKPGAFPGDRVRQSALRTWEKRPAKAAAKREPALPPPAAAADEGVIDFGKVQVELVLSPEFDQRQSTETRFLLPKTRGMVDAIVKGVGTRHVGNVVLIGVSKGGEVVLLNEQFRPQKLVAVRLDAEEVAPLRHYIAAQPTGRIRQLRGFPRGQPAAYRKMYATEFGTQPLDLVIDNDTHLHEHVVAAFNILFPRLRPGGLYIIESWAWAHWPGDFWQRERGGDFYRNEAPLSNLLIDLMLASAAAPALLPEVRFNSNAIYIERGGGEISPAGFELAQYAYNRGDPIPRFGRK